MTFRRNTLRLAALALVMAVAPAAVFAQGAGLGSAGELVDPEVLRVCADPSNMPFTDKSGEGFENKLAELVAEKTGRKSVAYTWFPMVMGFVRNTLRANRCDIIMGYAQGDELVQNTNAYYRSTYVLVYKKGSALSGVETIEDPRLAGKRIGVVAGTPPTANMAAVKLMRTAKIYPLMVDTRVMPSVAEIMMKDMLDGNNRRRDRVGADGRLLRSEIRSRSRRRSAGEGKDRLAHDLSHHHGSASVGPGMEAYAQSSHPGQPEGDQQDIAGIQRAAD